MDAKFASFLLSILLTFLVKLHSSRERYNQLFPIVDIVACEVIGHSDQIFVHIVAERQPIETIIYGHLMHLVSFSELLL